MNQYLKNIFLFLIPVIFISCNQSTGPAAPVNQAPIINAPAALTLYAYEPCTLQVSAADPDGDRTTVTLDNIPSGATFDQSSGLLTWQPSPAHAGNHAITVKATDGTQETADSIAIAVKAPSLHSDSIFMLLRPNGGETYGIGDTMRIMWYANTMHQYYSGGPAFYLLDANGVGRKIALDDGTGMSAETIRDWHAAWIENSPDSMKLGLYEWVVKDTVDGNFFTVSNSALLRAWCVYCQPQDINTSDTDDSDNIFKITP